MPTLRTKHTPKIAVAVFCEKVLQERDGVASVIRIVDRARVKRPSGDKRDPVFEAWLFVSFRADGFVGKKSFSVRGVDPKGNPWPGVNVDAELGWNEPDHIANVTVRLMLAIKNEGQHWFDVALDGEPVSRIPLTIVWTTPETQSESAPARQTSHAAKSR